MMARMCRRRRCFRPAIDPRDASARRNQPACALLIAGSVFSAGARARAQQNNARVVVEAGTVVERPRAPLRSALPITVRATRRGLCKCAYSM